MKVEIDGKLAVMAAISLLAALSVVFAPSDKKAEIGAVTIFCIAATAVYAFRIKRSS